MLGKIKSFYNKRLILDNVGELERSVGNAERLLDVGCGTSSPISLFRKKNFYAVGVDAYLPSIERARAAKIHNEYVEANILDLNKHFEPNSFDTVISCDVIEHLEKDDGYRLINEMTRVASKRVIIFTPNGYLPQGIFEDNPWQVHLSGWNADEMKDLGFKVIGVSGWKPLRGEGTNIRFAPFIFWRFISDITQIYVRNKPRHSFNILCVKDISEKI